MSTLLLSTKFSPLTVSGKEYRAILEAYPRFPPYALKNTQFFQLALSYHLYNDRIALAQLQQQSQLALWYAKYNDS